MEAQDARVGTPSLRGKSVPRVCLRVPLIALMVLGLCAGSHLLTVDLFGLTRLEVYERATQRQSFAEKKEK